MSAEPLADDGAARPLLDTVEGTGPLDRRRPNVSGDPPTVLEAAPMFRRAVAGYDRFEVDTYVRWAEDELATADREHEDLVARYLRTRAALEDSRRSLSHSSGGVELLRLSRRIGAMLAAAADEAESMRADAEADRTAAAAQADRMVADAERVLTDARAEAERVIAAAATEAEAMTTEAGRVLAEAEQTARDTRAESEARLDDARTVEELAVVHARHIRQQAVAGATAARLQARDEVVQMLTTGRERRRRADAEAAVERERLDRDAADRRASLLAEVGDLERRLSALTATPDRTAAAPAARRSGALPLLLRGPLRRVRARLGWHPTR